MKILSSILLILVSFASNANNYDLKQLLNERQKQAAIYKSIADSVIPGRVLKIYLINDQLQKVVSLDDSIITYTNQLIYEEARLSDSLTNANTHIRELSFNNDRLLERAKNDMKMLLILKVAAALLIVVILVLIYLYFNLKNKFSEENTSEMEKLDELEKQNQHYQNEIDRLKIKEISHKQEMDRLEEFHNSQHALLKEKYKILEAENLSLGSLTNQKGQEYENNLSSLNKLKAEKELLLRQHEDMKQQLADAKSKNETVMRKISKLITDLSSVSA